MSALIEDVAGVVIDIGSYHTRGGYSGEDAPRMDAPSLVGVLENEGNKEYFVDYMLQIRKDKMPVSPVTDRNGYGTLVHIVSSNGLQWIGYDFKDFDSG